MEVKYKTILKAIAKGAKTPEEITDMTKAGISCGMCIETIEEILEKELSK
jgi:nitrite reductase (NADH) large subunit